MTRTLDQMIASEVLCCMSSLVATVAEGVNYMLERRGEPATELAYQAFELAAPIDDWAEAAIQEGWEAGEDGRAYRNGVDCGVFDNWQAVCEREGYDAYESEVYEHWAVTEWFADKLEAAGEKVDRDFAGLSIWARTATGQSMTMDGVVQRIYAQTHTGREG